MTTYHRGRLLGTQPYADDEPDAVELATYDPRAVIERIELEEFCHGY